MNDFQKLNARDQGLAVSQMTKKQLWAEIENTKTMQDEVKAKELYFFLSDTLRSK